VILNLAYGVSKNRHNRWLLTSLALLVETHQTLEGMEESKSRIGADTADTLWAAIGVIDFLIWSELVQRARKRIYRVVSERDLAYF
jgi:hypothetical protein